MERMQCQKPGVAGACTGKPNFAGCELREIREIIDVQFHGEIVISLGARNRNRM
jgi:hypothetical protein